MKIATFNINNVNRRLPNLLRWLRAAKPDVVCLQELKATDADFPAAALAAAGYGAVWQRAEDLERRRHPGARRRAGADPQRPARRSRRHAEPLHRGGGQRRPHRLPLCAERQSAAGPEIRLQARLVRAAAARMPQSCCKQACRWCWPATTMSCRPRSTSIRRILGRGRAGAAGEPRRLRGLLDQGWTDAMRTLHPTSRSTRSGTTSGTAGRATPACGSTTCC